MNPSNASPIQLVSDIDNISTIGLMKKVSMSDFSVLKCIGRGSFGKVMLVEKKNEDKLFAMKILRKDGL